MRILIVGGTGFVGRAIAWSAWHNGHEVAVFNRGVSANDLPESIERLVGDRQGDLAALAAQRFDATVDVTAYRPREVERLAEALAGRGGRYVQISSISAYEDPSAPGATEATLTLREDPPDLEEVNASSYGPLKAACERAGARCFDEGSTMVRPTYVIGSFDSTLRFPYWVERVRRGGVVAVPGPREAFMQYVDARDLANFVVRVAEESMTGPFHVAGPNPPDHFVAVIEAIADHVGPPGTTIEVVSPEAVREARLSRRLPLWSGGTVEAIWALDSSLALSKGLDLRPLSDSVDDVVAWWQDRPWPEQWLTSEQEARLLSRGRAT